MEQNPRYYLVEASALPEVFLKVAEAKRLLETGAVKTVNEAAQMTGISRSAVISIGRQSFLFRI